MALSLGSNLGDRYQYLYSAIIQMELDDVITNTIVSSIYETEPWGNITGNNFLNVAVIGTTNYQPLELLNYCKQLEIQLGRTEKGESYSPRTIDIDILLYDDIIWNTPELKIPHPKMLQRNFVLIPLNEIAPQLKIPTVNMTVYQALQKCTDQAKVKRLSIDE